MLGAEPLRVTWSAANYPFFSGRTLRVAHAVDKHIIDFGHLGQHLLIAAGLMNSPLQRMPLPLRCRKYNRP
ncbi:hypothetical protein [Pseudomonas farris]